MFVLRFVADSGLERNITCSGYEVSPRDGWKFVTALIRDPKGNYGENFCVGEGADWCSMFAMNINGQTIGKIVPTNTPA